MQCHLCLSMLNFVLSSCVLSNCNLQVEARLLQCHTGMDSSKSCNLPPNVRVLCLHAWSTKTWKTASFLQTSSKCVDAQLNKLCKLTRVICLVNSECSLQSLQHWESERTDGSTVSMLCNIKNSKLSPCQHDLKKILQQNKTFSSSCTCFLQILAHCWV